MNLENKQTDFTQLILNESPDAIIVTSSIGVVVDWTKGAETVFGYVREEAIGHTLAELIVPPSGIEEERRIHQSTCETGSYNYESLRKRKDGAFVYVDSSSKAIYDKQGKIEFILYIKKDVTRLKAQRDAKLVEAKYKNLLESTPDGIVIANSTGRIVLANSQAESLFGYGSGELLGQLIEVLLPKRYRADHLGHRAKYFDVPRTRTVGGGIELYGIRKDEVEFPVEISLSPLDTEAGTMVMSAIRDISERKRIERALYEKNVELQNANQSKDRFLASMSHELRTPLNAIIGFTGTLLMRLPGPLTVDQDKQLKTIQLSARHLLSLINDLLDVAKIESGNVELQIETVNYKNIIKNVAETLRPLALQKGLAYSVDLPEADILVRTDPRALSQIIINLINNAIKFTTNGVVRIILNQRQIEDDQILELSVVDTGTGIREEDREKLFQAFSQLDSSSTRRFEGTGLGLYLSQKLAVLMGGEILFSSEAGKGSTFTLHLKMTSLEKIN